MIGSIILIVLGVMALIGIGSSAVKDFGVPVMALVLVFGAIVGLNFIPTMTLGYFSFGWGSALLFVMSFAMWLFRGTMKNRIMCLLTIIVLAGLLYGATRIGVFFNSALWSRVNVYYALMIGLLAFVATRNAKYTFIASTLSIMTATLLTQIGEAIVLDEAYTPAIIAAAVGIVLYSLVVAFLPSRPTKTSYYFETARMKDE